MKGFSRPPLLVSMVMEAVLLILGVAEGWASAKKVLANPTMFIEMLQTLDSNAISARTVSELKKFIENPDFNENLVARISQAAGHLA